MTKKPKKDDPMLARLNRLRVKFTDLVAVMEAVSSLPPERRSLEASILQVLEVLPHRALIYRQAVVFRIMALAHLLHEGPIAGFSFSHAGSSATMISEFVLKATASCPLQGERALFDRMEFEALVLRLADPQGSS